MKKMLLMMNPYAGMRKANRYLADILTLFNRDGYEITTYMTAGPGDGARAVEQLGPGKDLIVCVGGDGTFNETITGLLRGGLRCPVGYIPAGSTNDFANSLKLQTHPLKAAEAILCGTPEAYDVGKFGDRYFSYVASFGAFTRASYATPQNIKNALGHTAYVLEGIQELSQIRKEWIHIETDTGEVIEGNFLFGAISNSTSVGGILTLDPKQVDMGDGLFELLLVREPKSLLELQECIRAVQSQKYNCSMIRFCSASRLTVTARSDMPWTLDGEKDEGRAAVQVENLHHAITLIR
jgi:YegS/Rv2252/BmrU family lipid kinase